MTNALDLSKAQEGVFDALIEASERFGPNRQIVEDQERKPLTYRVPDPRLHSRSGPQDRGPDHEEDEARGRFCSSQFSSVGAVVTFFALQAFGRVPTMLNFTSGPRNLKAVIGVAGIKSILSSRRFVAQARLEEPRSAKLEPLSPLRLSGGCPQDVIGAAGPALRPPRGASRPRLFRKARKPADVGVILFTSGSFAAPRGVVLTPGQPGVQRPCRWRRISSCSPTGCSSTPCRCSTAFGLTGGILHADPERAEGVSNIPRRCTSKIIPGLVR